LQSGPPAWGEGYVYLNGQLLAQYSGGTTYFAHTDALGSVRLLTGMNQSVAECDDYLPFGELLSYTGCTNTGITTRKFTGYERDSETGSDYAFARYYGSRYGSFLSGDPMGGDPSDPQSLNRYPYVRNNPVSLTDPSGLCFNPKNPNLPAYGPCAAAYRDTGPTTFDVFAEFDIFFAAFTPTYYQSSSTGDNATPVYGNLGLLGLLGGGNGGGGGGTPAQPQTTGSPLSPKGQVCQEKVQSALNTALNTSAQFQGPELEGNRDRSEPGLINGAYNFNYFVPGVNVLAPGVLPNCGRFDSGLHVIVPGRCNFPSNDPFTKPYGFNTQQNGSYITAHIDSANPFGDLFGFFSHLINDVILRRPHGC
jgi:RHS repeat-associated protein